MLSSLRERSAPVQRFSRNLSLCRISPRKSVKCCGRDRLPRRPSNQPPNRPRTSGKLAVVSRCLVVAGRWSMVVGRYKLDAPRETVTNFYIETLFFPRNFLLQSGLAHPNRKKDRSVL